MALKYSQYAKDAEYSPYSGRFRVYSGIDDVAHATFAKLRKAQFSCAKLRVLLLQLSIKRVLKFEPKSI